MQIDQGLIIFDAETIFSHYFGSALSRSSKPLTTFARMVLGYCGTMKLPCLLAWGVFGVARTRSFLNGMSASQVNWGAALGALYGY